MTIGRRVLLLATSMARGGAERQVVDIAAQLRTRGWTVCVLSMIAPSDFEDELDAAGVELASLDMTQGRPSVGALLRYVSFVRRWQPDVIHAHMVHANLLARIGRLIVPTTPVISTVHSVVEGRRWREIAYRLTDRLSSATTAVSRAATERYVRVGAAPRDRIITIPNGFEFSRARIPSDARDSIRRELGVGDAFLWLAVGRLIPEKGHDMLLEAFGQVRRSHPSARLVIAGEGPQSRLLHDLIRKLALSTSVRLLGERRDVPSLLAAGDAFVMSSRWEGLPMVLLEAAAQQLPIVSTDVGGCGEIAMPELGAVLTQPNAEAVAAGMIEVMEMTAAVRANVGAALRDHVKSEFDLGPIVTKWEELYASVTGR